MAHIAGVFGFIFCDLELSIENKINNFKTTCIKYLVIVPILGIINVTDAYFMIIKGSINIMFSATFHFLSLLSLLGLLAKIKV